MAKMQNEEEKVITNSEINLNDIMALMQDMKKEIAELKKDKTELQNKNNNLQKEIEDAQKNNFKKNIRTKDSEVTLYFNLHGRLDVTLPDLDLQMEKFGEERQVTYQQFQQLMGKKRKFFEKEYLLVGPEDLDLVEKYKVKAYDPTSSSYIHYTDIEKFPKMTGRELEDYYKKLSKKSKHGFLTLWMNKCYNKEEGYYDVEKMYSLNRASNSKTFDVLINEMTRSSTNSEE